MAYPRISVRSAVHYPADCPFRHCDGVVTAGGRGATQKSVAFCCKMLHSHIITNGSQQCTHACKTKSKRIQSRIKVLSNQFSVKRMPFSREISRTRGNHFLRVVFCAEKNALTAPSPGGEGTRSSSFTVYDPLCTIHSLPTPCPLSHGAQCTNRSQTYSCSKPAPVLLGFCLRPTWLLLPSYLVKA
jgi:hypothetical protein